MRRTLMAPFRVSVVVVSIGARSHTSVTCSDVAGVTFRALRLELAVARFAVVGALLADIQGIQEVPVAPLEGSTGICPGTSAGARVEVEAVRVAT